MEEKLLDILAAQVGCRYLSQLREPGQHLLLCRALSHLEAERFSVEQWLDASRYLLEADVPPTVPRVPDGLARWLGNALEEMASVRYN